MSRFITREMLNRAAEDYKRTGAMNYLGRLGRSLARYRRRRRAIAELEAMDDKLLRDIGIYRNDIARVVHGFDDRDLALAPAAGRRDTADRRGQGLNRRSGNALPA